jgi:glutamate-5-semialdehyde dehydrogenase
MKDITTRARKAARELAVMPAETKDRALAAMAEAIGAARAEIKKANEADIDLAAKSGKSPAFLDRLALNDKRIDGMCIMMRDVFALKDPIGDVIEKTTRPNGLVIEKVRAGLQATLDSFIDALSEYLAGN